MTVATAPDSTSTPVPGSLQLSPARGEICSEARGQ